MQTIQAIFLLPFNRRDRTIQEVLIRIIFNALIAVSTISHPLFCINFITWNKTSKIKQFNDHTEANYQNFVWKLFNHGNR